MNPITEAMRHFRRAPLVDLDTPHEPSARKTPVVAHADSSPRTASAVPGVDGPTAPTSPGAVGHPIDWDNIRRDLAHLRSVLTEALEWIDEIDPTPGGLAAVAVDNEHSRAVIDLDSRR